MASTETQEFTNKTQRNWSTQAFGMCFFCGEVHHPHQMEGHIVDAHMRWSWYSQNLPPHNTSIYQKSPQGSMDPLGNGSAITTHMVMVGSNHTPSIAL